MGADKDTTYYSWLKEALGNNNWNVDDFLYSCHNQETEFLEFKSSAFIPLTDEPETNLLPGEKQDDYTWHVVKSIIAFANGSGGCV